MNDGIIKGNGTSRYLKSVPDFLSNYPTYADFVAALVSGNLPIDLNGMNDAGWTQKPTLLNKANLLSDAVASAIGTSITTPNDALNALNNKAINLNTAINNATSNINTLQLNQETTFQKLIMGRLF